MLIAGVLWQCGPNVWLGSGLQDCPGPQVRSGSCSQEPSHSLSVQRFWKGAGSLPDVSNYELYYDEHFKKNLPPHQYDMVMEQFLTGRLDAKILPAVLAKRKDFRPAEFSFLLLENQDSMESLDFLSLGSSDQQEKLQKLHKQLCAEQAPWRTHLAKLKAHEDACTWWFQSTSHAPARCLGGGLEGAEDIESADSCRRLMQCWSIAGQSGQNNCFRALQWKPPEHFSLSEWSFWAFQLFTSGISPKRGSVPQGSSTR